MTVNKNVKIVILSKDRPIQLYALLESLFANCIDHCLAKICVLVNVSEEFLKSYEEIEAVFSDYCEFIYEKDFPTELSKQLMFDPKRFIMFLVDDIIFKKKFSLRECCSILESDDNYFSFSLRLGEGLNYCYPISSAQKEPTFRLTLDDVLVFKHWGQDGDWGYPMSLDGSIFKTSEFNYIACSLPKGSFKSPNHFEGALASKSSSIKDKDIICFPESVIVNIPDNRVQDEVKNKNQQNDHKRFLTIWGDGLKIDISKLKGLKNNSCHFPVEFEYIKR